MWLGLSQGSTYCSNFWLLPMYQYHTSKLVQLYHLMGSNGINPCSSNCLEYLWQVIFYTHTHTHTHPYTWHPCCILLTLLPPAGGCIFPSVQSVQGPSTNTQYRVVQMMWLWFPKLRHRRIQLQPGSFGIHAFRALSWHVSPATLIVWEDDLQRGKHTRSTPHTAPQGAVLPAKMLRTWVKVT